MIFRCEFYSTLLFHHLPMFAFSRHNYRLLKKPVQILAAYIEAINSYISNVFFFLQINRNTLVDGMTQL